jgi:hypothetical protein
MIVKNSITLSLQTANRAGFDMLDWHKNRLYDECQSQGYKYLLSEITYKDYTVDQVVVSVVCADATSMGAKSLPPLDKIPSTPIGAK